MAEEEILVVEALNIAGDVAPLNAPLTLDVKYKLAAAVPGAHWELVYEADMANKRQAVALHTTAPADLAAGVHAFTHTVPEIKTEGIKEKYLLQVGLLKLTLHSASTRNIVSVNMMTQVSKGPDGLMRSIISPLE